MMKIFRSDGGNSMSSALPASFLEKMSVLLKEDFDDFMASYNKPRYYGLRINTLKINEDEFLKRSPFASRLEPVPWAEHAFYYEEQDRPGKHPHYHAGMYYIQEPSAMVPVELLDVHPGHRVLDLCAAPGGKSTQIASKLRGKGVLVTNDLATERTKALAKNIELAGVRNAVVLNEHPAVIAEAFEGWFDRVLVDAPCSGEGMFRKNDSMIQEWENYSVERCSAMQRDILDEVAKMVAPGGKIVYSTCTFSPEENEEQVARFLARAPQFSIVQVESNWGWANGQPQWVSAEIADQLSEQQLKSIEGTIRLWPHRIKGEGHFVAVLQREGEPRSDLNALLQEGEGTLHWPIENASSKDIRGARNTRKKQVSISDNKLRNKEKQHTKVNKHASASDEYNIQLLWEQFANQSVSIQLNSCYSVLTYGSRVYMQPEGLPPLAGIKVVRPGWYIGEMKNNKFVPSHPLAMGLNSEEALRVLHLDCESEKLQRYLKGETIFVEQSELTIKQSVKDNGYLLICVDDCPVGFGKYVDGMVKNELPAGWRLL